MNLYHCTCSVNGATIVHAYIVEVYRFIHDIVVLKELIYPDDPRPLTVDVREGVLTYKSVPRPMIVEVISARRRLVET